LVGDLGSCFFDPNVYKNVEHINQVSHEKMLSIMSKCTLNFAFYDPSILINLYAQPQKIYDSLSMGVPLIVNSEMIFSQDLLTNGCCVAVNYHDYDQLCSIISSLQPEFLNRISVNSSNYYSTISNDTGYQIDLLYR
jgi:hypothetical protein